MLIYLDNCGLHGTREGTESFAHIFAGQTKGILPVFISCSNTKLLIQLSGRCPSGIIFSNQSVALRAQPETKLDVCNWQNSLTQGGRNGRGDCLEKSTFIGKRTAPVEFRKNNVNRGISEVDKKPWREYLLSSRAPLKMSPIQLNQRIILFQAGNIIILYLKQTSSGNHISVGQITPLGFRRYVLVRL